MHDCGQFLHVTWNITNYDFIFTNYFLNITNPVKYKNSHNFLELWHFFSDFFTRKKIFMCKNGVDNVRLGFLSCPHIALL